MTGWITREALKTCDINRIIVVYTPVKKCCSHQVGANSPDISLLSVKGRGIHMSYTTTWRRFLEGQLFHGQGLLTNRWRQAVTCNTKYYTSATQVVLINSSAGNPKWIPSNLVCYALWSSSSASQIAVYYGTLVQKWDGRWCYNQIILFLFWVWNFLNYAIWNSGMRSLSATNHVYVSLFWIIIHCMCLFWLELYRIILNRRWQ